MLYQVHIHLRTLIREAIPAALEFAAAGRSVVAPLSTFPTVDTSRTDDSASDSSSQGGQKNTENNQMSKLHCY